MPYVTEESFAARFGQDELDQVTATNGGLEFDVAEADAAAQVDSYLAAIPGRAFVLPLTTPPARIAGVAADLTRYELWANRASEEVQTRRDQAIEFLKDLVAGRAMLLLEDQETIVDTPVLGTRLGYRAAPRVFTGSSLQPFVGEGCDDREAWRG